MARYMSYASLCAHHIVPESCPDRETHLFHAKPVSQKDSLRQRLGHSGIANPEHTLFAHLGPLVQVCMEANELECRTREPPTNTNTVHPGRPSSTPSSQGYFGPSSSN